MHTDHNGDTAPVSPGAAQAIAYHNHEADQAHRQALVTLEEYNAAMIRMQAALSMGNVAVASQAETDADAAWSKMRALLELGYQHRNSAAIAAGIAAEIHQDGGHL